MALIKSAYDSGDLLAKKFGSAGGWMADAARNDTELLQSCGRDFSKRDDLIARKQFEKIYKYWQAGGSFGFVGHTIA